jgi:hypothetical protein
MLALRYLAPEIGPVRAPDRAHRRESQSSEEPLSTSAPARCVRHREGEGGGGGGGGERCTTTMTTLTTTTPRKTLLRVEDAVSSSAPRWGSLLLAALSRRGCKWCVGVGDLERLRQASPFCLRRRLGSSAVLLPRVRYAWSASRLHRQQTVEVGPIDTSVSQVLLCALNAPAVFTTRPLDVVHLCVADCSRRLPPAPILIPT